MVSAVGSIEDKGFYPRCSKSEIAEHYGISPIASTA